MLTDFATLIFDDFSLGAGPLPQHIKWFKSWEFGKTVAQIFCLERATIVQAQGASEDKKCAA